MFVFGKPNFRLSGQKLFLDFKIRIKSLFLPSPSEARARQQSPKIRILKIGGAFWLKSELFLTKIRTANFDAPPRRRSLTLATPQKSFLHIFYFARARFFLLKGKENFFAGLCSERAGRRGFASARARRNSPHTPLPPRPRLDWLFFRRNLRVCQFYWCAARLLILTNPL